MLVAERGVGARPAPAPATGTDELLADRVPQAYSDETIATLLADKEECYERGITPEAFERICATLAEVPGLRRALTVAERERDEARGHVTEEAMRLASEKFERELGPALREWAQAGGDDPVPREVGAHVMTLFAAVALRAEAAEERYEDVLRRVRESVSVWNNFLVREAVPEAFTEPGADGKA